MMTETINKKYKYNFKYDQKEEWYASGVWQFIENSASLFKTYKYKDDDVLVCTYPRSGTHMTWLLVRYLLQGNTEPIKDAMEDSHLPPIKASNAQEGRRAFNTHYLPAHFGDDFFKNYKHKFIHVSRNPKDALVSMFFISDQFRKLLTIIPESWPEYLPFVLTTDIPLFNWFTHMRAWEEFVEMNPGAPILDLKFEEIVRNPETAIKKMANFLDVPLSDKLLKDIVVASKFENMKDAPVTEELVKIMGPEAKGYSYYRKGKIGDWVNTFTVAQNEMFDAAYKEQMKGSNVKNIYH